MEKWAFPVILEPINWLTGWAEDFRDPLVSTATRAGVTDVHYHTRLLLLCIQMQYSLGFLASSFQVEASTMSTSHF